MRPTRVIRTVAAAASGLALCGCAWLHSRDEPTDLPTVVRGSTVIVHMRWSGDDPLPTAERYCALTGRYPWPRTITEYTASYQCLSSEELKNVKSKSQGA